MVFNSSSTLGSSEGVWFGKSLTALEEALPLQFEPSYSWYSGELFIWPILCYIAKWCSIGQEANKLRRPSRLHTGSPSFYYLCERSLFFRSWFLNLLVRGLNHDLLFSKVPRWSFYEIEERSNYFWKLVQGKSSRNKQLKIKNHESSQTWCLAQLLLWNWLQQYWTCHEFQTSWANYC